MAGQKREAPRSAEEAIARHQEVTANAIDALVDDIPRSPKRRRILGKLSKYFIPRRSPKPQRSQ